MFDGFPPGHVHIGDCLDVLASHRQQGIRFDAVVSDPPFELGMHGQETDRTGVAFSSDLWTLLHDVLKPGAFVAAFASGRLYHRLATAAETAGLTIYPMLVWKHDRGLPKPANLSEMFDRENVPDRRVVGYRDGSGYTVANGRYGAQRRLRKEFAVRERHVSDEAKAWAGYYYGLNALAPDFEVILLAQRPISAGTKITDHVREHGTGVLNVGAMKNLLKGAWPSTIVHHPRAQGVERDATHPTVKPIGLMQVLCELVCPMGGKILDPFAGTGTTGVAAIRAGFTPTLIEINPAFGQIIQHRVGQAIVERDHVPTTSTTEQSSRLHVSIPKGLRRRPRVTPPEVAAKRVERHRSEAVTYRAKLADRGLRSVQLWVWDVRHLALNEEIERQAQAISAAHTRRQHRISHG